MQEKIKKEKKSETVNQIDKDKHDKDEEKKFVENNFDFIFSNSIIAFILF